MSNWKNKVDLHDLHKNFDEEKMDAEQVAQETAKRLEAIKPLKLATACQQEQFEEIIEHFQNCDTTEEYDYALDRLYDFGDAHNLLWVNVMFSNCK